MTQHRSDTYAPGGDANTTARKNAHWLAPHRGANEWVHDHPRGAACTTGCVVVWPDGTEVPVVGSHHPQPQETS